MPNTPRDPVALVSIAARRGSVRLAWSTEGMTFTANLTTRDARELGHHLGVAARRSALQSEKHGRRTIRLEVDEEDLR